MAVTTLRAILFDAVGTLIEPEPPVARVYCAAAAEFGSRLNETEIQRRFAPALKRHMGLGPIEGAAEQHSAITADQPHITRSSTALKTSESHERERWRAIVAEVIDDVSGQAQQAVFAKLWDHFASPANWRVFPDVEAADQALRKTDLILGIASNFDNRLQHIASTVDPLSHWPHIFHSAEIGFSKPSLGFFREIERRLQLEPEQILLVGDDRINDFEGARAAGWQAVLLDRRAGPEAPPWVIRSLAQLTGQVGWIR